MVFAELHTNGYGVIYQTERNTLVMKDINQNFYQHSVVFLKVLS